ncbi:MAG: hypothetical protein ABFR89_05985 [Actinomycetota bacterium]
MSPTAVFVLGIIGSGLVTIAGIYAVALRRGPFAGPIAAEETERHLRSDKAERTAR